MMPLPATGMRPAAVGNILSLRTARSERDGGLASAGWPRALPKRQDLPISGFDRCRSKPCRTLVVMQGWFALAGAMTGGLIAIVGQFFLRLADRRNALVDLLLEQCAQVIALAEDMRNRVWEERRLGLQGPVSEWSLGEYRLAEARLKVACRDPDLHSALRKMEAAGEALGKAWRRRNQSSEDEIEAAWQQHRAALDQLVRVSGILVEGGIQKQWRW